MRRLIAIAVVAAACLAASIPPPSAATEQMATEQGLVCTACHDKPGSKLLTDEGKYFELMGSLEGFAEIEADFGACTSCHARKPGSKKLTREGRRFALVLQDMEALKQWAIERHPRAP
jgi:hypothetical protein